MPAFVLNLGDPEGAKEFAKLDAFTRGYIEAMFFTECNEDNPDLVDGAVPDLAPSALASIHADCEAFCQTGAFQFAMWLRVIELATFDDEQAGRDFWFTRNGHGVGFWDRDAKVYGTAQDALSEAAQAIGETYLYRGDDGKLYVQ